MAYKDLQEFIDRLENENELLRIKAEVSSELEITEITDRVSKKYGKALLFENVKGSKFPVLINAMGTYRRMNLALGSHGFDEVGERISNLLNVQNYMGMKRLIKSIPGLFPLLSIFPRKVKKGSCQEVVIKKPDLHDLPVLTCWPKDGGKFITLPLVFTRDPETKQQNVGMYRMQVMSKNTTGMHWHLHKDGHEIYEKYRKAGRKMPVSVALGSDPAITYAATAPLPKFMDEMSFAGFLRKKPVRLVKCKSNNIFVPADAEFVIEGYVDAKEELVKEGPFGDHTGYYSLADYYPKFHVTCITHRKDAVYPTTIVGRPPMEDCYMGKATEQIFLPLLKMQFPEIVNYNFPLEGVFHNCVIVSIKKRFPGGGKKIANSLWGLGQMMYTKMIIVVEEGLDPYDIKAVAKAVLENVDMEKDLMISEGPLDALDHASDLPFYGNRLAIDATKDLGTEGLKRTGAIANRERSMAESNQKALLEKYPQIQEVNRVFRSNVLEFVAVSIHKSEKKHGQKILRQLFLEEGLQHAKVIAVFDETVDIKDPSIVAWKVFNNIDAKRDLAIDNKLDFPRLGIDATKKTPLDDHKREWPQDIAMSEEIIAKVDKRWKEYGIDENHQ